MFFNKLPNLLTLVFILALPAFGCSPVYQFDYREASPLKFSELTKNPQLFVEKMSAEEEALILIEKGQEVTLKSKLAMPFLEGGEARSPLKFTRDVYLIVGPSGFMISPDALFWANGADPKAIAGLFGATKGSISIGFSMTKEEGAIFSFIVGAE